MSALWKWISGKLLPIFHCIILHFPLSQPIVCRLRKSMCVLESENLFVCVSLLLRQLFRRNKFSCGFVRLQRFLNYIDTRSEQYFPPSSPSLHNEWCARSTEREATNFSSFFHSMPRDAYRVSRKRDESWVMARVMIASDVEGIGNLKMNEVGRVTRSWLESWVGLWWKWRRA